MRTPDIQPKVQSEPKTSTPSEAVRAAFDRMMRERARLEGSEYIYRYLREKWRRRG